LLNCAGLIKQEGDSSMFEADDMNEGEQLKEQISSKKKPQFKQINPNKR